MTKEEWNSEINMLNLLREVKSDRKLKLFLCGCYRRIWEYLNTDIQKMIIKIELGHRVDHIEFCNLVEIKYDDFNSLSMAFHASIRAAVMYGDIRRKADESVWTTTFTDERTRQRDLLRHMVKSFY
jgi:hypothetical protein